MNAVIEKFKDAWIRLDEFALSECVSDKVKYFAWPSCNCLAGSSTVMPHISEKFQTFKDFGALSHIDPLMNLSREFNLVIRYEKLVPVTTYAINSHSISMVVCFEPRNIQMNVNIKFKYKGHKISEIKIFQEKNIECRKTA